MIRPQYKIDFQPAGSRIDVPAETTLLAAAQLVGVDIKAICGGIGVCGGCRVRLVHGTLSEPGVDEPAELGPDSLAAGYRLACQTHPTSDARVEVPPDSAHRLAAAPTRSGADRRRTRPDGARLRGRTRAANARRRSLRRDARARVARGGRSRRVCLRRRRPRDAAQGVARGTVEVADRSCRAPSAERRAPRSHPSSPATPASSASPPTSARRRSRCTSWTSRAARPSVRSARSTRRSAAART